MADIWLSRQRAESLFLSLSFLSLFSLSLFSLYFGFFWSFVSTLLTTQIPYEISIATMGAPRKKIIGKLRIKFVRASAPIQSRDVELLQYLDVLKALKKIPDADIDTSAQRMQKKLVTLSPANRKRLQQIAVEFYPPRAKALLGLLLSNANLPVEKQTREAINSMTQFKLGLSEKRWPDKTNWQIK
jgi:hypothetical protein